MHKKVIFTLAILLLLYGISYAVTVGKLTGFDWGIVVGGKISIPSSGEYEQPEPTPSISTWQDDANAVFNNDTNTNFKDQ